MNITSEQYREAYNKLPYILRSYLVDDELSHVTETIGKKYSLHVDTVGALYREVTNMLLGLENPQQFTGELKSIGIPEANIAPITQELNQSVFIPLQEKMKNGDVDPFKEDAALAEELGDPTPIPDPQPVAPTPVSAPAPTPVPTPMAAPAPAEIPDLMPTHTPFIAPAMTVATVTTTATPAVPEPVQPAMRTMQSDMRVAQEQPQEAQPVVTAPIPQPIKPNPAPYIPLTPKGAQDSNPHREELKKIVKEYSADPYREPME